ncbi:MAG: DUF3078 domain-containing protein [Bacteroidales bacterium]
MPRTTLFLFLLSGLLFPGTTFSQSSQPIPVQEIKNPTNQEVPPSTLTASEYISFLLESDSLWRSDGDSLRLALQRLILHVHEPFDSVGVRLARFNYQDIELQLTSLVHRDTLPVRWLNDSTFIFDTLALQKEPFIIQETLVRHLVDTIPAMVPDSTYNVPEQPDFMGQPRVAPDDSTHLATADTLDLLALKVDSLLQVRDTITRVFIDTTYLESLNLQLYKIEQGQINPGVVPPGSRQTTAFVADSTAMVFSESFRAIVANEQSPFFVVPHMNMPDSLEWAVNTLLGYTQERDSIPLYINDVFGKNEPFWLTTGKQEMYRYWIRNAANDSITVWVGNPSTNDLTLLLEDDVYVERLEKKAADDIPIISLVPLKSLARLEPIKEIPTYWNYGMASAFTLNQTYLSNWARGGANALSSMLDVNVRAAYTNKEAETQWNSSGRIRYGTTKTEEQGFRTSTDILELNSQYNRVIQGKVDFSTVFYFKTQIAKGYKYPNDSVVVSKFMNPGTFTVGAGIEYKPDKDTRINFSVLSYKNTFVLDTSGIDQTKHGISANRMTRPEMGGQLVVTSRVTILDGLEVYNSLRLFSGYLEKPQNIDVDWEISLEKQLGWYFTIRPSLHLIYDDDILFPVLGADNEPVLLPDGSEKKVPRLQLKQFLGLTLSFKL